MCFKMTKIINETCFINHTAYAMPFELLNKVQEPLIMGNVLNVVRNSIELKSSVKAV